MICRKWISNSQENTDGNMFIKPRIPIIKYRGYSLYNNPVNLSLCQSVQKGRISYPDYTGVPCIKFLGCNTEWVYTSTEERDKDFEAITNNTYGDN